MDMTLSKYQEIVNDREAYTPRGHTDSDMTEQLNNNKTYLMAISLSPPFSLW